MIPTRSPYTDPAWLATLHIVPTLDFDPEEERKRIAERDRRHGVSMVRGVFYGFLLSMVMWGAFIAWLLS